MSFFHVDRRNILSVGDEIDSPPQSTPNIAVGGEEGERVQTLAQEIFEEHLPQPVTEHGKRYALQGIPSGNAATNFTHEFFLEMVRQAHFPEKQSRFTSIFVWENQEDAEWFAREYPGEEDYATILEVEGDVAHKADFTLAAAAIPSFPMALTHCHLYWRGEPGYHQERRWELLLTPPVRVLSRVNTVNV